MSLEGYVDAKLEDFKKGLFVVTMEEKAKLKYSDLAENVGGYELKKVEVTMVGDASDTKGGLRFKARGSELEFGMQNPEKSKEDPSKKVRELLGQGKTLLKVTGTLREVKVEGKDEKKLVLDLESAEPVEKKK